MRTTRSRSRQQPEGPDNSTTSIGGPSRLALKNTSEFSSVSVLSGALSQNVTGLTRESFRLLEMKQRKLWDPNGQVPKFTRECNSSKSTEEATPATLTTSLAQAAAATLVFAQQEAGTAVCISSNGILLTCSHCVADTYDEYLQKEDMWLLFASGCVVRAKCVAWDLRRDLALLRVVAAQDDSVMANTSRSFPFVSVGNTQGGGGLLCIGHPGSEDLEAPANGMPTDYEVLHISTGRFRGLAENQDPQDNSDIGALMHDCWTYWGHSGAPLIWRKSGSLVGLHSSWDSETGMRRGVPLEAIKAFLSEHTVAVVQD